mgnify:CR=1 FL=1
MCRAPCSLPRDLPSPKLPKRLPKVLAAEDVQRIVYGETRMPRIELGWSELLMVRDGNDTGKFSVALRVGGELNKLGLKGEVSRMRFQF